MHYFWFLYLFVYLFIQQGSYLVTFFISACIYIVFNSYILSHTYIQSYQIPPSPISSAGIHPHGFDKERAETLLKAMKVEKSLLEVPRFFYG